MLNRPTTLGPAMLRVALVAALAPALGGCFGHRPGGNMRSNDMFTYDSTSHLPVSVALVDSRTDAPLWEVDVPVGQRLVVQFMPEGAKQSSVETPDLMRWELYPTKNSTSFLRNAMPVPGSGVRRLDVTYREAPEYAREDDPYATIAIVPSTTGTPAYSPLRPGGRQGTYYRTANAPGSAMGATVIPEPLERMAARSTDPAATDSGPTEAGQPGPSEAAATTRSGVYLSGDGQD